MSTVARNLVVGVMLLAMLVGAGLVAAHRSSADPQTASTSANEDCVIPSDESLAAGQTASPSSPFPYQEWLANDDAQKAVAIIATALDRRLGEPGEGDPLSRGLIGVTADHYAQELVVVVDPALVDREGLEQQLGSAVQGAPLRVRTQAACHSAKELLAARDVIEARAWHPRVTEATYAYDLDAKTSRFGFVFAEQDRDVAYALQAVLGDKVTIEFDAPSRASRLNDGEPHWGGAGIRRDRDSINICTSAFTAVMPSGRDGSISAGHCFNNHNNIFSGSEFYGKARGESNFPQFDMIRIVGQTYARRIHVDPCCPVVRTVVGDSDPALNSFVCVSGMVTRAVCGLEVRSVNASFCDVSGCTPNLIRAVKPGERIVRAGDSGGPVYNRFGSDNAAIRGMIIAGNTGGAGDRMWAHKVSTIRNHLNVNGIASQPTSTSVGR
jgi:hypothetical protein